MAVADVLKMIMYKRRQVLLTQRFTDTNIDPFFDETTIVMTCDVVEPSDGAGYDRDPRSIAKRAEAYLKVLRHGRHRRFGPEPEFFIFDDVRSADMSGGASWRSNSKKAAWNTGEDRRRRHRPPSDRQGRLLPGAAGRQPARHPRPKWCWCWKTRRAG